MTETGQTPSKRLAANLAAVRQKKGCTVEEAAAAIGESLETLLAIEAGTLRPTAKQLVELSNEYGVLVKEFVGQTGDGKWIESGSINEIDFATGRDDDEARENLRRKKAEQMPYWRRTMPDDITDEEFDALIVDTLEVPLQAFAMLNTYIHAMPAGFLKENYETAVKLIIRDMWLSALHLRASVTGEFHTIADKLLYIERVRGTFVGFGSATDANREGGSSDPYPK